MIKEIDNLIEGCFFRGIRSAIEGDKGRGKLAPGGDGKVLGQIGEKLRVVNMGGGKEEHFLLCKRGFFSWAKPNLDGAYMKKGNRANPPDTNRKKKESHLWRKNCNASEKRKKICQKFIGWRGGGFFFWETCLTQQN